MIDDASNQNFASTIHRKRFDIATVSPAMFATAGKDNSFIPVTFSWSLGGIYNTTESVPLCYDKVSPINPPRGGSVGAHKRSAL